MDLLSETPTTPSEDHGDLEVIAQTTIAPDDIVSTYSGSLNTVTIANTGTGVGEYGGFNVARHIKFGGVSGSGVRSFNFAFDTSNREEITFSIIRGTDSNGGELTDSGEDLLFEYSTNGGSTWTGTQVLVAYNDAAFNTLNDVTVTLPTAARVSNAQFRIRQASNSGSNYDQWGVTAVTIGGEILTTEDYGFLTPARQTVPYGRLKIVEEFADERLLRNSVGGIEFTLGGEAHIFTLPIHVGRGFFRLDGKEFTRITLRYIGSGTSATSVDLQRQYRMQHQHKHHSSRLLVLLPKDLEKEIIQQQVSSPHSRVPQRSYPSVEQQDKTYSELEVQHTILIQRITLDMVLYCTRFFRGI